MEPANIQLSNSPRPGNRSYPYQTFQQDDVDIEFNLDLKERQKTFLWRTLIIVPAVVMALLLFFKTFVQTSSTSSGIAKTASSATSCAVCPQLTLTTYCADTDYPVMGGMDVVGTYNSYDSSLTYQNEATTGESTYSADYAGYTFYFASAANKALFKADPTKYLPQWGGFCSWGVATEFCPTYPWSASCMGPSGNWQAWTVVEDKMYFFLKKSVLDTFLLNTTVYIETGNERWTGWFGDSTVLSTQCYVDSDDD